MPLDRAGSVYILVIDDDQAVREFLADQLISRGYKVMTADNGTEAVECVRNSKFHLVITDLKMPGMDGLQILEAIKKVDSEAQVILASGHGNVELAVDAMKKGAYHFLSKPIVMKELFALVERALEKSRPKLETLLETALGRLREIFHADEGSFMLLDKNNRLYIACSLGLSEEIIYSTTLKLGERVAGLAAKRGREFLINGGLGRYPEFRGVEKKSRIRSSLVLPIYCRKKLLGILNLNRIQCLEDFTKEDVKAASLLVSQIAQDVQDARFADELEAKGRELKAATSASLLAGPHAARFFRSSKRSADHS